jgi:hypothetical protein
LTRCGSTYRAKRSSAYRRGCYSGHQYVPGLDKEVPFKHGSKEQTRCRVYQENGATICEVVFGPDIFPGKNVADPNSSLSMRAAAAHEITHFHRWSDKTELDGEQFVHIDEALTSLGAVQRFYEHLNDTEISQLIADAIQRLQKFANEVQSVRTA